MLWPMLESALGARMQEMMEIQSLSTAPSKQGRGYASALVQVVNDLVSLLVWEGDGGGRRAVLTGRVGV